MSIWAHILRQLRSSRSFPAEGPRGIADMGHRLYVGGMWEHLGRLQFDFLRAQGLRPDSCLIDIACGSLRLGVHAIPYLEPGHYLGLDKEEMLVQAGLKKELDPLLVRAKRPQFVISSSFEFEKFGRKADWAIAQSLFTHLPSTSISSCLQRLRSCLTPNGVLYATFFRSSRPAMNPKVGHDHRSFVYTTEEMVAFGETNGYSSTYLGDWGHPRGQVMVEYHPVRT